MNIHRIVNKYYPLSHKLRFSTTSDPYYILGVQKNAPFDQIKSTFFQLANEYHPDKNSTKEANRKFILVKQAFQMIKMQKGLMKPQSYVNYTTETSVRPNPEQFSYDSQQFMKDKNDYRIFKEKSEDKDKYSYFNSSFKTISDIKDIRIRVQEGELQDSMARFSLQKFKGKIQTLSENGKTYIFILILGIGLMSYLGSAFFEKMTVQKKQQDLKQILKNNKHRQLKVDSIANKQRELQILQKNTIVKEMKKNIQKQQIKLGLFRNIPKQNIFYKSENLF